MIANKSQCPRTQGAVDVFVLQHLNRRLLHPANTDLADSAGSRWKPVHDDVILERQAAPVASEGRGAYHFQNPIALNESEILLFAELKQKEWIRPFLPIIVCVKIHSLGLALGISKQSLDLPDHMKVISFTFLASCFWVMEVSETNLTWMNFWALEVSDSSGHRRCCRCRSPVATSFRGMSTGSMFWQLLLD
jgi:hypothetical protein